MTFGDSMGVNETLRVRATHADWIAIISLVVLGLKKRNGTGPIGERARVLCGMVAQELHKRLRLPAEIVIAWKTELRVDFPDGGYHKRLSKQRG